MATLEECQYKNETYNFTCHEPARGTGNKVCIFHDINYLKGDNYAKNKEEVVSGFEEKLSKYSSNNLPLEFVGYCLPDISFRNMQFAEALYFGGATFYGEADFYGATFFNEVKFDEAKFSKLADFGRAKFSKIINFYGATFSELAAFTGAKFFEPAYFNAATFFNEANFIEAKFFRLADFYGATFFNRAYFNPVTFSNDASFIQATFSKEADFYGATFSKEADFNKAKFCELANFGEATFSNEANFGEATFLGKAYFSGKFSGLTFFNHTIFEQPTKVTFGRVTFRIDTPFDMSNVSFADSDITRIRFSDKVIWGGDDKFTIIEEMLLIDEVERVKKNKSKNETIENRNSGTGQSLSPELVLSVYRNLRENYEFRLRYGDAGKFFIKEMELKRKYREAPSSVSAVLKRKCIKSLKKLRVVNNNEPEPKIDYIFKENGWWRRQFSLTGLYYHFSKYGESIARPTIVGAISVGLSTLFWLTQADPTKDPSLSKFVGAYWILHLNPNYLERAFERSLADFLPLLSLPSEIKVGVIDYIIKIFGGALTFGLLAIALRRKFERKYTR